MSDFIMRDKEKWNEDVPREITQEYLIKELRLENGKLKSEVDYLQYELEKRDKAIAAFKQWQERCVKYKWEYWVNEAYKLTKLIPNQELHDAVKKMMHNYLPYKKMVEKFDEFYSKMKEAKDKLDKFKENGITSNDLMSCT